MHAEFIKGRITPESKMSILIGCGHKRIYVRRNVSVGQKGVLLYNIIVMYTLCMRCDR